MKHELKAWPIYFKPVLDRKKLFEVRRDDRGFMVGDELILREYKRDRMGGGVYTGREITATVTYVLRDPDLVKKDFCVLGLEVIS